MKARFWILIIIGVVVLSLIVGSQLFPKEVVVESTYALTKCQNKLTNVEKYNDVRNPISTQTRTFVTDLETNPYITNVIGVVNICGRSTTGPIYLENLRIKWLYDDTYEIEGECQYWTIFRS